MQYINTKFKIKETMYQINHAKVTSPCSGIVMEKKVNEGEYVAANVTLFQIGQTDPILFDAMVSEEYINIVKLGKNGSVEFNVWPGKTFKGIVSKIEGKIETSKIFHVYISIANPNFKIKPGLSGFAKIYFKKKCIVVPNISILKTLDRKAHIFIIDSHNRAHIVEVETGLMNSQYTEILKDIKAYLLFSLKWNPDLTKFDVIEEDFNLYLKAKYMYKNTEKNILSTALFNLQNIKQQKLQIQQQKLQLEYQKSLKEKLTLQFLKGLIDQGELINCRIQITELEKEILSQEIELINNIVMLKHSLGLAWNE